jgi:hypothetical protein
VEEKKRTKLFWLNEEKLAVGVGGILAAAYGSQRRKRKIKHPK